MVYYKVLAPIIDIVPQCCYECPHLMTLDILAIRHPYCLIHITMLHRYSFPFLLDVVILCLFTGVTFIGCRLSLILGLLGPPSTLLGLPGILGLLYPLGMPCPPKTHLLSVDANPLSPTLGVNDCLPRHWQMFDLLLGSIFEIFHSFGLYDTNFLQVLS